jgi:hypothetical protein
VPETAPEPLGAASFLWLELELHVNVFELILHNTLAKRNESEPRHFAFPEPDPEPHENDTARQH